MTFTNTKVTLGRKLSHYIYESAIDTNPSKIDNSWTSLKLGIRQEDSTHEVKLLAVRPHFPRMPDRRKDVVSLKHVLDMLKNSGVEEPEMSIFYLGHKKVYPDKPPETKAEQQDREIGLLNLMQINLLYFDEGIRIGEGNLLSTRVKEAIEVPHPVTGDLAFHKLLFYNLNLSLQGLDLGGALALAKQNLQ